MGALHGLGMGQSPGYKEVFKKLTFKNPKGIAENIWVVNLSKTGTRAVPSEWDIYLRYDTFLPDLKFLFKAVRVLQGKVCSKSSLLPALEAEIGLDKMVGHTSILCIVIMYFFLFFFKG